MEQILTGSVDNQPGVLAQITAKLREMSVNIISINVSETEGENRSHITIVIQASAEQLEKIHSKLETLIQIHNLELLGQGDHYEKELILVQVALKPDQMSQLMQIAELFRAHVVGVGKQSMTLEYVGEAEQVRGFFQMLKPFGIIEMARTGRTALKKDK